MFPDEMSAGQLILFPKQNPVSTIDIQLGSALIISLCYPAWFRWTYMKKNPIASEFSVSVVCTIQSIPFKYFNYKPWGITDWTFLFVYSEQLCDLNLFMTLHEGEH